LIDHQLVEHDMTDGDARTLVRATLMELGLDVSTPERIIQAQHDFAFLRYQRDLSERISFGVRMVVLTTMISGALAVVWVELKMALGEAK
jgi:hypothetical protein